MEPQLHDALLETVKSGIVVRAFMDKRQVRPRGKMFQFTVRIDLLVRRAEGGILWLKCNSVSPRLSLTNEPDATVTRRFLLDGDGLGWMKLNQEWQDQSDCWTSPRQYSGEMLTPYGKEILRPNHPRLLQELVAVQVRLETVIKHGPPPDRELIRAYIQLGHFIEDENFIWDRSLGT